MRRWSLRRHIGVSAFVVMSLALGSLATRAPGRGEAGSDGPAGNTAAAASPAPGQAPGSAAASVAAARSPDGRRAARVGPVQTIRGDLSDPQKKDIAMRVVSSAENSTLDWTAQYGYIEDIHDGRGYTGGIVGFCSGTGDMRAVVERYTAAVPGNRLAAYLPALKRVNGSASHAGLDPNFTADWRAAAADPAFRAAQDAERDRLYFNPALSRAKQDGLRVLGQFAYYDAIVMHGANGLAKLRRTASVHVPPPARGGDEAAYLEAFLDARVRLMASERGHDDESRINDAQRVFLAARNFDLDPPLHWRVYGDSYEIAP
ncbi:chitosanase [Dactylosporangium sp. NPDC000555]|uniref:chitosanase n=1 Tax=Dactylosporangium sp. NPDC000555 TaxID=3154260 RepID=UPI0033242D05